MTPEEIKAKYHSEWKTGKWRSNSDVRYFESYYIRNEPTRVGKRYKLNPNMEYMIGPPVATQYCTQERLLEMNTCGVYERPKSKGHLSVEGGYLQPIADRIRNHQMSGQGWYLDLDTKRVEDSEMPMVLENIADFIADGITKGHTPYWCLEVS